MTESRDRRTRLHELKTLNGIDFIEITNAAQTALRVSFLEATPDEAALRAAITEATITGGETIPTVAVKTAWSWHTDATTKRPFVDMRVDAPGDFSTYTFRLVASSPVLDLAYDHVPFTFKAGCPSTIDCEAEPTATRPPSDAAPPIDYLAKDFDSFRRALSDFSTVRYPAWQERSEADFGVMFMEALASVADDLSYQQDRVAAEAWLETATQRRSLVRLARLVDYEPRVATAATTMLQFQMTAGGSIPRGVVVGSLAPDGSLVEFETGAGLADEQRYEAHVEWNEMRAHWFDDEQRCVAAGATELYILRPDVPLVSGQRLVIEEASSTTEPPRRGIVELEAKPDDAVDLLFGPQPGGTRLSRIVWRAEDALPFALDLAHTTVRGNLVPATHGRTHVESFVTTVEWSPLPGPTRAVVRTGPGGSPQFLHTLSHSPLAWLGSTEPGEAPRPELAMTEPITGSWSYLRDLLSAKPFEQVFTLDPARYRPLDGEVGASEYDGDDGDTVRFGDGELGAIPPETANFAVTYRVGGGLRGNVAAGALTRIDAATASALGIAGVSNPLPARDGRDQETNEQVRERAPQKFRTVQRRAVRAEDYDAAVTRELPESVHRAGTQFRYTGSWLTVFTTVDPRAGEFVSPELSVKLGQLLDRYRLAGYEAFGLAPRYVSLDLSVAVCALPSAFRGDVQEGVLAALGTFFDPDHFTFGQPLERSALEAALQNVPGVDGVTEIRYRRRGQTAGFVAMLDTVEVAVDELVRADNDPNRPEAGSFRATVGGGK